MEPNPRSAAATARGSGIALVLAFAAVVGSFAVTNLVVQRSSRHVGERAAEITDNVSPSIERLALVRRSILETEIALERFVREEHARPENGALLDAELERLRSRTRAYLELPPVRGEEPLRASLEREWLRFEDLARDTRTLAIGSAEVAARTTFGAIAPTRQRVLDDVTRAIEVNAAHGRDLADSIRTIRRETNALSLGANILCAALAALAAWLLHRQTEARHALVRSNLRFHEERAAEMERFSGRVAHDIRNPLQAARLAAELASRKSSEQAVRDLVARIVRSLARADTITTGLLEFARSGSQPEPGARTDVRAVVDDTVTAMEPEARSASIELRAESIPHVLVACSEGVYASLLGNLVRNALKYMGDRATRRIVVTVTRVGDAVRTEVADTGPGISPSHLGSLFEPYFRAGKQTRVEGLGLGLATVKKLVESHGGRVGVRSEVGHGSAFWFDLPAAGIADDAEVHAEGVRLATS